MIHPSALGNIKSEVAKQLKKRIGSWDPERDGVLVSYKGRKQVLNGGRGRVVDTSPFVQLVVRYTGVYAKPTVGAKLFGKVQAVTSQGGDKVTIVCVIEGELTAIISNLDNGRFTVKKESTEDSDEDSDSNVNDSDSIIDDEPGNKSNDRAIYFLEDTQKGNRRIQAGSKIKLQLEEVKVSEGTILSYATLI